MFVWYSRRSSTSPSSAATPTTSSTPATTSTSASSGPMKNDKPAKVEHLPEVEQNRQQGGRADLRRRPPGSSTRTASTPPPTSSTSETTGVPADQLEPLEEPRGSTSSTFGKTGRRATLRQSPRRTSSATRTAARPAGRRPRQGLRTTPPSWSARPRARPRSANRVAADPAKQAAKYAARPGTRSPSVAEAVSYEIAQASRCFLSRAGPALRLAPCSRSPGPCIGIADRECPSPSAGAAPRVSATPGWPRILEQLALLLDGPDLPGVREVQARQLAGVLACKPCRRGRPDRGKKVLRWADPPRRSPPSSGRRLQARRRRSSARQLAEGGLKAAVAGAGRRHAEARRSLVDADARAVRKTRRGRGPGRRRHHNTL